MNKLFSTVVVALAMFSVMNVSAQKSKSFAGTIKFHIKYEGNIDPRIHVQEDVVYTIFGNKIKFTQGMATQITDGDAVTQTVLYDVPGDRAGYVLSKEYIEELIQSAKKYTYKKSNETKTICGYVCTRYDVTIYDVEEDEETKAIVYTTTEIGEDENINSIEYPGLTGYPLYKEVDENGVKTISEAIEIKATKVKSVDFLIPSDYKMMTKEEFQEFIRSMFGGGE